MSDIAFSSMCIFLPRSATSDPLDPLFAERGRSRPQAKTRLLVGNVLKAREDARPPASRLRNHG
jgi:hypothetical protein